MPIVDYGDTEQPLGLAKAVDIDPTIPPTTEQSPDALSLLGAAFRQDNIIGSALSDNTAGLSRTQRDQDETFNPLNEIKGTPYESYADDAASIYNRRYFDAWKADIDRETQDRRTIEAGGWWGTGASAVAAILDAPSLIPGGELVTGARTTGNIARSAGRVALAGGVGAAASEAGLQATQETRTATESAIAIGSGVVFGGLLGAGAGALMSRAEQKAAVGAIDVVRAEVRAGTSLTPVADEVDAYYRDISAGAARAATDTLDDLSIAGTAAAIQGKATAKLNPLLRALHSPSLAQRRIMNGLVENTVYLKKNLEGEGVAAVETLQKQWDRGAYGLALEGHVALYKDARRSGLKMSRSEFADAVGRAMRRGDQGEDEFVTRAAKNWREKVIEPLKKAAQETGQLPADLPSRLDETYLHRVYRRDKIRAQEVEFKQAIRPYIEDGIDRALKERNAAGADAGELDFASPADRQAYVDGILTDIVQKVTGANQADIPYGMVSVVQGPLKDRTLRVPDRVIEPWLEDDVELIGRRYARKMSADVEIARRFGRADMRDQITEVFDDYEQLKKGVTDEKQVAALNDRRDADIADLKQMRDMLRGQYLPHENSTNFARLLRVAQTYNFMRTMGGQVFANLTEVLRPAMVHGLTAYMGEGLVPLINNLQAVKLSAKDAKLCSIVSEVIGESRIASMAELTDPYSSAAPFERYLNNAANLFSKLTGLSHLNDFNRTMAAVLTQNRILENVGTDFRQLASKEKAYLGYLGIDQDTARRIASQYAAFGEIQRTIRIANIERWDDVIARRAYQAAVAKDVDSIIMIKGVADTPSFSHTPAGRAFLQFKSFALASNQRVLMRGLQEGPARAISGIVGMTTIGAMIYYFKQIESGRPISNNPGVWVSEGLDRSGIFSIAFEVNNMWEKWGGPGVYSALAATGQAVFPGVDAREPASRYASRSTVDALAGPSVGLINDVGSSLAVLARATNGNVDVAGSDIQTLRRLMPYATLPMWRWLIDGGFKGLGWQEATGFQGVVPELKAAVAP